MADKYGNEIEDAIRESGYSIRKLDESALLAELAALRKDAADARLIVSEHNSQLDIVLAELDAARQRVAELEAEVVELTRLHNIAYDALGSIYYHGTDKPAAMCGSDDAMWWKGVAHDCMRIAGDAFCTITQPTESKE